VDSLGEKASGTDLGMGKGDVGNCIGCGPTNTVGLMLAGLIVGRRIVECREVTTDDLIAALEGVPPDKVHCPAPSIGPSGYQRPTFPH